MGAEEWDAAQDPVGLVPVRFLDQIEFGLAAQGLQGVELLVQTFAAAAQAGFGELVDPLRAALLSVQGMARAGDGLAAVERLDPAHHPGAVFGERGVTAAQLAHRHRGVLSVVDRREEVAAQQVGQLVRIDAVALVAALEQRVLARITDQQFGYASLQ